MIDEIMKLAVSQIGMSEFPAGSDKTPYGVEYGWNGVAWCAIFQWWLCHTLEWDYLYYGGGKTASCSALISWYEKNSPDQIIPVSEASKGDWIIFEFKTQNGRSRHIGICESKSAGKIVTIDGNTGPNCDKVMRRQRDISLVICVIRPGYTKHVHPDREITVWSAPAKLDENRVKKIPAGYDVTVYETPFEKNGDMWYRTIKNNYVLANYCK